jgi:phenylalanyl-tRNA synthetase beta chain
VDETGDATTDHLAVEVEDPARCPRFVGRWIDGVTIGPSPFAVQRRLIAAGVRPISNVVDASNHVMLELGKPIHTFDADAIRGGTIVVRSARPGERLTTLDHVERVLDPEVLLIADRQGPLGLAGVMGGVDSEVEEGTTRVVVESAIFDPVSIRRTAFRFALRSEASLRFEKGQEHRMARVGADRTAQLILRWAGGRAATGVVDTAPTDPPRAQVPFRPTRVSRLLGLDIPAEEQMALLARVEVETVPVASGERIPVTATGYTVEPSPDALVAIVPPHRRDLVIEADIAEEVARVRGYETLPGTLPSTVMPAYRPDPRRLVDRVRGWLAGAGLTEIVTHGLIGPDDHARLGIEPGDPATIVAANPVTMDHSELRRSLLPGLLRVVGDEQRLRRTDVAVFEVGPTHTRVDGDPAETSTLAIALTGSARPATWAAEARAFDVADGKGLVELLARRLGEADVSWQPVDPRAGVDHPGRIALAVADAALAGATGPVSVGRVGEIHPTLLAAYDIRAHHVVFAELSMTALATLVPDRVTTGDLDRPPAVERDLAIVIRSDQHAGDAGALIRSTAGPALLSLALFDRYVGAPLAANEVSLAWRLRLDPAQGLADDAAVDDLMGRVVGVLSERIGARVRG